MLSYRPKSEAQVFTFVVENYVKVKNPITLHDLLDIESIQYDDPIFIVCPVIGQNKLSGFDMCDF